MESEIKEKKRPWGVAILGGINCFILGALSLILFYPLYRNPDSITSQALIAEVNKFLSGQILSSSQFKIIVLAQIAVALIFLFSGIGVLLKREWGRRLTIYFSFFTVIVTAVSVLFSSMLVNQAILQVIYPGVLIFYFTNKKVEEYFGGSPKKQEKGQK